MVAPVVSYIFLWDFIWDSGFDIKKDFIRTRVCTASCYTQLYTHTEYNGVHVFAYIYEEDGRTSKALAVRARATQVRSKASFNLLGGYMELDYDASEAKVGINNNFYITSPKKIPKYCDIQGTPGCLEMDFIEANGNCVAASTWHTENGHIGKGNCNKGGCQGTKKLPSNGKFHLKASFTADGTMTVTMDGDEIKPHGTQPNDDAKKYVKETLIAGGARPSAPCSQLAP